MKRLRKTNPTLVRLIEDCNSLAKKSNFWKKVSKELSRATRRMRTINLDRLNKVTKPKETIVIPGKLLGLGALTHDLTIYAFKSTNSAKERVKSLFSIQELIKKNPEGKGTRIIC